MSRPPVPLSTLQLAPRGTQRKLEAKMESLLLFCGALSSLYNVPDYPASLSSGGFVAAQGSPLQSVPMI